jgi:prepilin-type N-terminal cleavage/methylation domain-containing protein
MKKYGFCASRRGFSLVEAILAVTILAIISITLARFMGPTTQFFKRFQVRYQLTSEGRTCVDTIARLLAKAKPETLIISTPPGSPPNSQIQFDMVPPSATSVSNYTISWSGREVLMNVAGGIQGRRLASNVIGLIFTGDSRDPAMLRVTLQMEAPWDQSGQPDRVYSLLLSNQVLRVGGS